MPQLSTFGASSARGFGLVSGAGGGGGGSVDTDFDAVTLLLPGNGTNGAQNNTFLDSSSNGLTITRNGNTTQGTFSPFSQTGWSNYFDGSGDYLRITSQTFSGNFTLECWIYPYRLADAQNVGEIFGTVSPNIQFYVNNSGQLGYYNSTTSTLSSANAIITNTWQHIAICRSGTTTRLFINGQVVATNSSDSGNRTFTDIGTFADGNAYYFQGYMSNVRWVATDLYTSAFTPPTAPLTAISGTRLLTCQSNRFVDNSSNAFAITVNGNTSVQAFSPFNPTAAYSAGTVGGSAYLDGSGDYLTISNPASLLTFGTGDFTVECFVYPTVGSSSAYVCWIYGNTVDIVAISVNSNTGAVTFTLRGTNLSQTTVVGSTGLVRLNEWTHLALVRTGTNFYGYVNGTRFSTTIAANAAFNEAQAQFFTQPQIGASSNPVGNYFTGYVSGWRALKGTALYTAATITVPSAPLTAIANTSALLNSTNAGITDAAAKNVMETAGNVQESTAQSKFGGSSIAFDGSGDYLQIPASQNFVFGSGNFTVEFWLRLNSNNVRQMIAYYGNAAGTNVPFLIELNTSFKLRFLIQTSGGQIYVDSSATPSTNTWIHVAGVRNGTSAYLFVDGISQGTITPGTNALVTDTNPLILGMFWGGSHPLNGYINDFRITKGIARYTANFTAPTAPFPLL